MINQSPQKAYDFQICKSIYNIYHNISFAIVVVGKTRASGKMVSGEVVRGASGAG
jgi:hypothetical protein